MTGEAGGALLGREDVQGLEVARRGEVALLPGLPGEGVVRDLADQGLDEAVPAALGRPWVGVDHQHLAPDELAQSALEGVLVLS